MPDVIDPLTISEPNPSAEETRVANAFEDRLKTPGETPAPEPDITKNSKPPETTTPEKTDEEFPEHIIEGTEPPKLQDTVAKDEELEGILPPPKMSQTAATHWNNLKGIAEKRGAELARLQKELEAAKAVKLSEPDQAQSEAAKLAMEKVAELTAELERAAFERSPKFKELIAESQSAIALAKSYLEGTEVDPSVIDRAASLAGAKRLAVLREADLDPTAVGAISAHLAEHDKLSARRETLLAQHKTAASDWEAQQRVAAEANEKRLQEQEEKVFSQVGTTLRTKMPVLQKVEGMDNWNAQVDALEAEAKDFFHGKLPLEKMAEIAYAGVAYRVENRRATILGERLKAALAENAKLKVAQPGAGDSSGSRNVPNGANGNLDNSEAAIAARFDARLGHG